MNLVKFQSQRGAKSIKGSDLDQNFARVSPKPPSGQKIRYRISETPSGWQLYIIPELPPYTNLSGTYVLGCRGGTLVWLPTEAC